MLPLTARASSIRRTIVDLASAGAQEIAPALEGRRVRILAWWLACGTEGTMIFEDTDDTPAELAPDLHLPEGVHEVTNAALETAVEGVGVTLTTTTAATVAGVVFWAYV